MKYFFVIGLCFGLGHGFSAMAQEQGPQGKAIKRLVNDLPDDAFTASPYYDNSHKPSFARFHSYTTLSNWSARIIAKSEWLKVDLGQVHTIQEIATKGRYANRQEWVKSYMLSYSTDDKTWTYYGNDSETHIFKGNIDTNTEVKNKLNIKARYIRFHPVTWNGHITMRVELYGY